MARKPRVEYPGAFYHVMTRGNRKQVVFKDDKDRLKFLRKLLKYKERYGFVLYAYTLMKNHLHLLIETQDVPLSRIMQGLLQSYTQWYNGKYRTVGHLFQGRYKAILCDKKVYLLNLIRYIHLNCIRAGLVKEASAYKWSSHRIYLGVEESKLIDTDFVLSQFASGRKRAIKLYEQFVLEWIGEGKREEYYRTVDQRFLGEEDFINGVKGVIGEESLMEEITLRDKSFGDILQKVSELTGVGEGELRGRTRSRRLTEVRSIFVKLCLMRTSYKRKEIARYLGRVPRIITYLEDQVSRDRWKAIQEKLRW